jgi:hypothetical protein
MPVKLQRQQICKVNPQDANWTSKTTPPHYRTAEETPPAWSNRKDNASKGLNSKRHEPQKTWLNRKRHTSKGLNRKDSAPNRSNHKRHVSKGLNRKRWSPHKSTISVLATAYASPKPACRQYWVFWEAMGKLMQWQACIRSCSVDGSLLAWWFAFNRDDDRFACSKTMGISNLSLSLSHEYHHPDSLQLTNGKDGSNQHLLESIEEAYYLVEVMLFVSVFLPQSSLRRWWRHRWRHVVAKNIKSIKNTHAFSECVSDLLMAPLSLKLHTQGLRAHYFGCFSSYWWQILVVCFCHYFLSLIG